MKRILKELTLGFCAIILMASTMKSGAFALLGPIQPWMQVTNGVINADDIGGPMLLTNEYRWNVPVVTYGFDQSFRDFFGTNGVAAVASAIQILNELPPASQMVLTNYPFRSQSYKPAAQELAVRDLKSTTLMLLLEQLGLGQPTRNLYVRNGWNPDLFEPSRSPSLNPVIEFVGLPIFGEFDQYGIDLASSWGNPGFITNFVTGFNFDPSTHELGFDVNQIQYSGLIWFVNNGRRFIQILPTDSIESQIFSSIADKDLQLGGFYTALTYDDVGGLAYLLSSNNVNYESLITGVVSASTNTNLLVNSAWRPGVEKITFLPQPVSPVTGVFQPTTNYFNDRYFAQGDLKQQPVARVISQPDFLFSAGNLNANTSKILNFTRTGPTNWINNSLANGDNNGAGPGVIRPPIQFVFNKSGPSFIKIAGSYYGNDSDELLFHQYSPDAPAPWASFDNSTNPLVIYPIPQVGTNQMTVRMSLELGVAPNSITNNFEWKPTTLAGAPFALQTSTNLTSWVSLFTVTNEGTITTYLVQNPKSKTRFYRLNPL